MTKSIIKLGLLGLLSAAIATVPLGVQAKDTNAPNKTVKESKSHKATKLPFHGKLKAVDKAAKTISVGEMTLQITSETTITKDGKPATLDDGVVGENVGGSYTKGEDGKLTAGKLHFGAKPGATEKTTKPEPKKDMTK